MRYPYEYAPLSTDAIEPYGNTRRTYIVIADERKLFRYLCIQNGQIVQTGRASTYELAHEIAKGYFRARMI